ncbi:MAG TPA: M3 family metallopeptidase [Blastocatellia bacterium]|nr:M3 family metallopeptidase [Blastocatellia bacterium]
MKKAQAIALIIFLVGGSLSTLAYNRNLKKTDDTPFWSKRPDAARFERETDERLASAGQSLDRMLKVKGKRTIENTLRLYDEVLIHLDSAAYQTDLIQNVHPDAAFRAVAEKENQKVAAFATALSLNHDVYNALAALELNGADQETRYYVERTLRDFRLAGVDKDEATRRKIKELRDELVKIGQEFSRNIRNDVRTVTVNNASELEGLPSDFIARHKPGADGRITLTIDYPDSLPVFSYAKNEDLRKRMYIAYNNRAYPKNIEALNRMIARRDELAKLLGFKSWADYITADKMVGSARNASDFIDKIVEASRTRAERDYQILLKRKQADFPDATVVNGWENSYYAELVRKSDYAFDSQTVRPYFAYDRVKQGVLDVTGKLFGVSFRQVKGAPVWHADVECWEMVEDGKLVGRFFLDMHPRPDKYNHAAEFGIRTGVRGTQIPEAALVCNFAGGQEGDPGLLTHDDVVTFFHEFGHLIHFLVSGQHQWVGIGGISTEQDFVEAPSQMLEEWTWDPATLASFAKHYQTNEPIPAELVKQMKRASEFGKGLQVRRQMVYAKLSLSIYDRDPKQVDTDEMVKQLTKQYQPFPFVEGTHFQTAFGHLDGYSAVYYTYMWSLVIAKDLFSKFDRSRMLAPGVAREYRDRILAPGGSRPAAKLVEDFLGRPFGFAAWQAWLNEGS